MVRKLTQAERDALYARAAKPQAWTNRWVKTTNTNNPKLGPMELSFTDILVLRRLQAKQSSAQISAGLKIARSTLNMRISALVQRFGVSKREELLDIPEIQEQLRGDDAK